MDSQERYLQLLKAIEAERKQEESYFSQLNTTKTLPQKIAEGFAWYPVEIVRSHYSVGETIEIEIKKVKENPAETTHRMKVGVSVLLFNSQTDVKSMRGVVSYLRKHSMSILLHGEMEDIEDFRKGLTGVEMMYDEKPYQIMKSAIKKVLETNTGTIKILKEAFTFQKIEDNNLPTDQVSTSDRLNHSQKEAIQNAMDAQFLSIIHGPPGTGKTTTLVSLAKEILKSQKRILVCASSNNAVDLLAKRIHEAGHSVLRIGNVTRIDDSLMDLTMDEKLRNHPEWAHIKKVKVQAQQLERQAQQYKRSFTPTDRDERKHLKRESRELLKWSYELENRLTSEIINSCQVIATTLISASHNMIDKMRFETVIIDEASQALEPECWNAILKANKVILAGDHLQLPPTVKSPEAMQLGLAETILDRMADHIQECSLLSVQYRMNNSILSFSNEQFYKGQLTGHVSVENHTLANDTQPLIFIDTAGCGFEESLNPMQKSLKNEGEYFILREFILLKTELMLGASIGLISPYAEQVRYIRQEISEDENLRALDIEVDTIDGFQGQEKDVIIISLVRSNDQGEIGFLKDERRLNVAMTRARKKLILIGDSATLSNHVLFKNLITHIEIIGNYESAWTYMKW